MDVCYSGSLFLIGILQLVCLQGTLVTALENSIVITPHIRRSTPISQQSIRVTPTTTTSQLTSSRENVVSTSAVEESTQTALPVTATQRNSIAIEGSQPPWTSTISKQSTRVTPPRTTTNQFTSFTKTVMLLSAVVTNAQTAVAVTASCSSPEIGMARGSIPDKDITASSELDSDSSASNARLGNTKAWIPRSNDQHPWIQVNLQYRRNLTAIVTQGFNGSFAKSYYVSYGDDGNNWTNYTAQGTIRIWKGNAAYITEVFSPFVVAQYIRLHPTDCSNQCAFRLEFYGCNVTTGLPGQPPAPTINSVSTHVIDISWAAPSDTGPGITGYNVQWQVVEKLLKNEKVITGSTTAKLDVTPYTEYDIQVRAYNGKGNGPWSLPLRVRSKESAPSAAPGNLKLTSSSSLSLDVSWDPIPMEQQQGKLLGYYVYYKTQGSAAEENRTVGPAKSSLKLTQLEYKTYIVRVAGYTAVGVGRSTAEQNKIPNEGAPTPPRNLNLVVTSSTSIRASWLEPLKFNGIFKRYVVMYGTASSKLDGWFFTSDKSYEITGLEEFTEYFVQVHAETSVSGSPSNIVQAKSLEDSPSSPPAIDTQETRAEDAHTIRVKWNEINKKDQNGVIQGYNVYYNEKGQLKEFRKRTTATNTIITGLKPFTEYCINVTGYTKVGESPGGNCFFVETLELGKTSPLFVFGYSSYTFHKNSVAQKRNWIESRQRCKDTGSDLVSIESEKEWSFLKNTTQRMETIEYYIGLRKDSKSGEWKWISDNSKVNAARGKFPWAKDQPSGDGDCAVMYKNYRKDNGLFNDLRCDTQHMYSGYICESLAESTDQDGRTSPTFAFGNSSYTFYENSVAQKRDWTESRQRCKDTGSDLTSIESEKEWRFLKSTIQRMETIEYYIGLKKDSKSGDWKWISDNSKVNATRGKFPWAKDQPSGDGNCAVMFGQYWQNYGLFNDLPCDEHGMNSGYICESPTESTDQEDF